ncbi:hypothetical protein [Actinomadura atramentaria]|uniref:hypothetical protein n=1 Tax=Actinomadura atramentaria TaxID=1990 RepID=UPI00035FB993|nr:hypothetical protein [Actinomadura atramentaria]
MALGDVVSYLAERAECGRFSLHARARPVVAWRAARRDVPIEVVTGYTCPVCSPCWFVRGELGGTAVVWNVERYAGGATVMFCFREREAGEVDRLWRRICGGAQAGVR